MKTLAMRNGDLVFENGELQMLEGDAELAQSVEILLSTAKGEWFLNLETGLDRTAIFNKRFNETEIKDSIITAMEQEPRIATVENIILKKEGRTLIMDDLLFTKAEGGEITLEGVNVDAR